MLKYINYNRKSTESEDKQILSINSQEDEAISVAQKNGLVILRTINESKSAKVPGNRKGFKELVRLIKRRQCNAIICWKLDRLARNMVEGGEIIELLQTGKLQEIRTPFKTYTPNENAILLAVEFGSANQFSRDLANAVMRGHEKKARMGIPHGMASFGYLNEKHAEKGTRKWLVDNERFPIVQKMFQEILKGTMNIHNVYFWLTENYHPTTLKRKKMGGRKLALSYFYSMLRNPVYAGYFIHDGIEYELHKSIPRAISKNQFLKIQGMLDGKNKVVQARHTAQYTGIIQAPDGGYMGPDYKFQLICDCKHKFAYLNRSKCPKCGVAIREMVSPKYLVYTYYYNSSLKQRRLPVKLVRESQIEQVIRDFISDFYFSNRMKDLLRKIIIKLEESSDPTEAISPKERKKNRITELEKRKITLRNLLVDGTIAKDEYEQDIAGINKEMLDVQISLVDTKKGKPYDAISQIVNLYDVMSGDSKEDKIKLLQAMESHLVWDEKTLEFKCSDWVQAIKNGLVSEREKRHNLSPDIPLDYKGELDGFRKKFPVLCSRQESNLDRKYRKLEFYPLNYES